MLISLMDALTAAVAAGGATTPVLVHSATYQGGIASLSKGTFALDDSLAAHARFAVYYYDLNHVGNTIHLTAPSGATFASVNMQEEDGDVNMISVNLHNAEVCWLASGLISCACVCVCWCICSRNLACLLFSLYLFNILFIFFFGFCFRLFFLPF